MTYANAFANISMICLLCILIAIFEREKIIKIFRFRFLKVLIGFLFFIIITSIINDSFYLDFDESRKLGQIILLIILFSFTPDKKLIMYGFISGTFISSLLTNINIINYYLSSSDLLILKPSVKELFVTERLYLGFLIVISSILLANLYQITKDKRLKYLSLSLIVFFLATLFVISSRSALIILAVVFLTTTIYQLSPLNSLLLIITAGLIFSTIIFTNKNLSSRFLYSEDSIRSSFIDKIKTHEPRYDIWKFSGQIFKEEKPYFFGIGTFKTQELLQSKYQLMPIEKRKNWFIERSFNTHNQYIDIALSYGIIGLFIFLIFVREMVKFSLKNIQSFNLVISLLLFLIVENIFHRQLGSFIFALTLVLALYLIKSKNEKNINC
jgi:O-antigen ligase